MRRSVLLCLAVVAIQASAAIAQPAQPWTGIAANEARADNGQIYGQGDNEMSSRAMSADGRFVVFDSNLSHLVYGDTNNWNDVFLRDRQTGELRRVSVASDGSQGNHYSAWGTISANGRHIAFNSCATNFDPSDTNASCDLFIHDRVNGTTVRANLGPNGEQMENTTQHAYRLSADGRYFVFNGAFDGTGWQVWLRDRDTDENGVFDEPGATTTTQISQDLVGSDQVGSFNELAISSDGRWIAYTANTWADSNYNNYIGSRVYLHDRVTGNTSRVDRPMANGTDTTGYASGPDFSESGPFLVYSSSADNLAEGDTDGRDDIYVFNVLTGGNVPIELTHAGAPAIDYEWSPAISADGRYVTFTGVSFGEWWNEVSNVYVVDRQTGQSYEISVRPEGTRDDNAGAPSISADGSAIAFTAGAEMLMWGWGNTGVFVATGVALTPADTDVPENGGTYTIELTAPATTGWQLQYGSNATVNPTSGNGSATIEVTIAANTTPDDVSTFINLGSEQVLFHQTAPPQIYYTMPYYGPTSGGTDVDIFGAGFAEGMTVEFGGTAATNVTFIASDHIVATTPAHFGGWVSVKVTKANGASAEMLYMFFFEDTTPPIVTPHVTGTLGANGWYTSDVTVTWTVEDDGSEIASDPCAPFTQTTDGASTVATCYAASFGGETFGEVPIKRDTVSPTVAIYEPQEEQEYNFGQVVPLVVNCDDATSGIATCTANPPGPNLDTTSYLGDHNFTVTAVDAAGYSVTSPVVRYSIRYGSTMEVPPVDTVYGTPTTLYAWLNFDYGTGTGGAGNASVLFFVDNVPVGTAVTTQGGDAALSFSLAGLNTGTHVIRAEFAGHASIRPSSATGVLTIAKATPIITWPHPADIIQGTPLSATQLSATTSVPGTFVYSPAAGTVLGLGVRQLNVSFTPQDPANYNSATAWEYVWVKAVPVITWFNHAITWPQTLSASVLDATASPAGGSFVYSPPAGTLLDVGTHTLSVTFDPVDQNYLTTIKTITLTVMKATPTVTFPATAAIPYGTALSSVQLNATASVPGSFVYTPAAGTILPAGTYTLSVVFTPTDTAHYLTITKNKGQTISHLPPTVDWNPPASMTWGTPLGPTEQNATSPLAGTFGYWPEPGTVLEVGQREIRVVFNPDDPNYSSPTLYRTITVTKAPSVITWNDPAPIVYGTSLSGMQLNATANVAGTLSYQPSNGAQLAAGTQTLTATFTPTDSAHYAGSSRQVTLVVSKRTPSVTWNTPAAIVYGSALSNTQLNATANLAGTFVYSPAAGDVLAAGSPNLSVTFTPADTANNNSAAANVTLVVNQATSVITWPPPSAITYGTALSATQLNATANVPGTFEYSPAAGTVPTAGTHALSVTFTPSDAANYTTANGGAPITVAKAAPVVSWANPSAIAYGTALSLTQLNATANVAGTFVYSPAAGVVLNAGTHALSVTFTPDDSSNYNTATTGASIVVSTVTPVISWTDPAGITHGTALSATQLNATANVAGSFAYSPAAGTVPGAGTQPLSVTFTPTDSTNYNAATANVSIVVGKATPVITWANPAGMTYGAALSATQLNATANVAGTFAYSPSAGTALNAGTQPLSVTFTPTDSTNYNAAAANVAIVVAKATPVITWANPAGITYGTALSATQLNATPTVPGSFAYSPAAGAVLGAGTQSLSVTFTPTDGANYTSASAGASVVIAKKALTVQANNGTKVYGEALPAFTASGTGFVNGDSMASLGGTLSFATSATATSAPGAYSVTPSGATSANYTISFAAGTLTVTKASTSLALATTPSPSNNNQQVQLRAVVSAVAPGAGTATGTVEFRENGTLLGTATLVNGIATMNKSFKRGTHPLTATYTGNTNFNGSSGAVTHQTN